MKKSITRRAALRGVAAGAALGAVGTTTAQESGTGSGTRPDFGGWLEGVDGGYKDARGQDEVTVEVGAQGNGGAFAFAPAGLWIDPGTTVTWKWTGKGGGHNVVSVDGAASFDSGAPISEAGATFSHTFEATGITNYVCEPHRALGMKGAVAVGDDVPTKSVQASGGGGGGTATRPDWGGWLQGVDGGFLDARGQDEVTVKVGAQGNGGAFAFAPAGLWIDPGTKVTWQWTGEGGGHNVVSVDGPASFDSGAPISEAGATFSYTFEATGITNYVCEPHRSLGMKGAVAVGDDVPTKTVQTGPPPSAGEEEDEGLFGGLSLDGGVPVLLLLYGVSGLAVLSVFGADWARGARQWASRVSQATGVERTNEAAETEPARELTHDEYDPWGTATLVTVYFLIITLMWVFMYFVEFLGNGPTIIG